MNPAEAGLTAMDSDPPLGAIHDAGGRFALLFVTVLGDPLTVVDRLYRGASAAFPEVPALRRYSRGVMQVQRLKARLKALTSE
jgi:hypothetical protein